MVNFSNSNMRANAKTFVVWTLIITGKSAIFPRCVQMCRFAIQPAGTSFLGSPTAFFQIPFSTALGVITLSAKKLRQFYQKE